MLLRAPLRGALRRALQRSEDPRLPAPLRRRGGGRRRRDAGAEPDDAVVATYREHGHALLRGVPMRVDHGRDVRQGGGLQPRPRRLHAPVRRSRRASTAGNAIVGGGLPLAVGPGAGGPDAADGRRVTACFFGDGAVAEGEFHESLNLAALWQLPVLFCCENNLYAMGTALERAESRPTCRSRPRATECRPGRSTAWTCSRSSDAARRAALAVSGGGGPCFLELRTYRFRAHSMYDPELYRNKEEVERWKEHDPIRPSSSSSDGATRQTRDVEEIERAVATEFGGRRRRRPRTAHSSLPRS